MAPRGRGIRRAGPVNSQKKAEALCFCFFFCVVSAVEAHGVDGRVVGLVRFFVCLFPAFVEDGVQLGVPMSSL